MKEKEEVTPSPAARSLHRPRTKDVGATPRRPDPLSAKPAKVAPKRLDIDFAAEAPGELTASLLPEPLLINSADDGTGQKSMEVSVTPSSIGLAVSTPSRGSASEDEVHAGMSVSSTIGVISADEVSPRSSSMSVKPESVVSFEAGGPGTESTRKFGTETATPDDSLLALFRLLTRFQANPDDQEALQRRLATQRSSYRLPISSLTGRITSAGGVSPGSASVSMKQQPDATLTAGGPGGAATTNGTEAAVAEEHLLALDRILARLPATPEGTSKATARGDDAGSMIQAMRLPTRGFRYREVATAIDLALLVLILLMLVLNVASRMAERPWYPDFTPT